MRYISCHINTRANRLLTAALLLVCVALAAGCSAYQLQGTVVAGDQPGVYIVRANDTRLQSMGIEAAKIEFTLDPSSLNAIDAGQTLTGRNGHFVIGIDEFGAGFLEYELGVLCRKQGFNTVNDYANLPPADRRLLIVMSAGSDTYQPEKDILDETLKMIPKE